MKNFSELIKFLHKKIRINDPDFLYIMNVILTYSADFGTLTANS